MHPTTLHADGCPCHGCSVKSDLDNKKTFSSGATSAHGAHPYRYMAGYGVKAGSLRYGYGNVKHEDGNTVLAEANWLKAFHARDLEFFQDRFEHAKEHIQDESQGKFDLAPGGNMGAVVWCADIMCFTAKFDPDFYMAVVGRVKHPGPHPEGYKCPCDRCYE